jgi:hypothetical protein
MLSKQLENHRFFDENHQFFKAIEITVIDDSLMKTTGSLRLLK